jgi:hypothetical protein
VPVQVGANATLFNVTCLAPGFPDLLNALPPIAVNLPIPDTSSPASPGAELLSGYHYFTNKTTPFFDLDTDNGQFGAVHCTKKDTSAAPNAAADVPWLHLTANDAEGCTISEVYRLGTSGGVAPASCANQPSNIYVQYAAQYWFWSSPAPGYTQS